MGLLLNLHPMSLALCIQSQMAWHRATVQNGGGVWCAKKCHEIWKTNLAGNHNGETTTKAEPDALPPHLGFLLCRECSPLPRLSFLRQDLQEGREVYKLSKGPPPKEGEQGHIVDPSPPPEDPPQTVPAGARAGTDWGRTGGKSKLRKMLNKLAIAQKKNATKVRPWSPNFDPLLPIVGPFLHLQMGGWTEKLKLVCGEG